MKLSNLFVFAIVILLASCSSNSADNSSVQSSENINAGKLDIPKTNQLSDYEKATGWKSLFDGKSMSQWRGYNKTEFPSAGWEIKNNEIWVIKSGTEEAGNGGDIITNEQYGNFEFKFDFMVSDTANSGIFYLAPEIQNVRIFENAPEFQVLDNITYRSMERDGELGDFKMEKHYTGDNYDLESAPADYTKAVGEWNTGRIKCINGEVEHWLNGKLCVKYEIGSEKWKAQVAASKFKDSPEYGLAKKGHIGIQDHGHTVRYRNLKIKAMD